MIQKHRDTGRTYATYSPSTAASNDFTDVIINSIVWPSAYFTGPRTVLHSSSASHMGTVRSSNDDAVLMQPPLFVVADGMGGYGAGDLASALVVKRFSQLAVRATIDASAIGACIQDCQKAVAKLAGERAEKVGSTVVAAAYVITNGAPYWLIANVGDSRAYLWHCGDLKQISHDHSIVQDLIDSGDLDAGLARNHPERHVITRAIGVLTDSVAEFAMFPALPDSRLLLCSDGLSDELEDGLIDRILAMRTGAHSAVVELVRTAISKGGNDNVTVIIVDICAQQREKKSLYDFSEPIFSGFCEDQ